MLYVLGIFGGFFVVGILNFWMGFKVGFFFVVVLGLIVIVFVVVWDKKEV